jgi:DNA-binding IclR family transcriptional regulator
LTVPGGVGPVPSWQVRLYSALVSADDLNERPARQGIQSVEIAMTVLDALEAAGGPASLTQLAAASGMQPSKVHRYLVSLVRSGLVTQSPRSSLYDFGPALRRLGAESLRRMDEVSLVSEHLPALRDLTGYSVNLAVWGDHGPVVVRWDYGTHVLPVTVRIGATMQLLSSSIGRVYLAFLPESLTGPILREQQADTGSNAVSSAAQQSIKAEVRRAGVAVISGTVVPGVVSVAAPVFTTAEALPLAVSIALPARQASAGELDRVTAALLDATRAMSSELGWAPGQPS